MQCILDIVINFPCKIQLTQHKYKLIILPAYLVIFVLVICVVFAKDRRKFHQNLFLHILHLMMTCDCVNVTTITLKAVIFSHSYNFVAWIFDSGHVNADINRTYNSYEILPITGNVNITLELQPPFTSFCWQLSVIQYIPGKEIFRGPMFSNIN